mmetsp:Transcript_15774/g.51716  ORF Transcript_15774/g.51716 Transcript_15774/m.51716 type:complete len:401 (+) Transcript_15774:65-1267(+)
MIFSCLLVAEVEELFGEGRRVCKAGFGHEIRTPVAARALREGASLIEDVDAVDGDMHLGHHPFRLERDAHRLERPDRLWRHAQRGLRLLSADRGEDSFLLSAAAAAHNREPEAERRSGEERSDGFGGVCVVRGDGGDEVGSSKAHGGDVERAPDERDRRRPFPLLVDVERNSGAAPEELEFELDVPARLPAVRLHARGTVERRVGELTVHLAVQPRHSVQTLEQEHDPSEHEPLVRLERRQLCILSLLCAHVAPRRAPSWERARARVSVAENAAELPRDGSELRLRRDELRLLARDANPARGVPPLRRSPHPGRQGHPAQPQPPLRVPELLHRHLVRALRRAPDVRPRLWLPPVRPQLREPQIRVFVRDKVSRQLEELEPERLARVRGDPLRRRERLRRG